MAHVPVPADLALPGHYRGVESDLHALDPELRLRRSAEDRDLYVLERRIRRSRPVATTTQLGVTDRVIQARDGYVHVATVHPWYLDRPHRLLAELRGPDGENDLATLSSDEWFRRFCAREQTARVQRHLARLDNYKAFFREQFDLLDRVGGVGSTERTRHNNPLGDYRWNLAPPAVAPPPAGEIPVSEVAHGNTAGAPSGGPHGQLHGQPGG